MSEFNEVSETMLQTMYSRATYSKSKNAKFIDKKAIEVVEKLDYDFTDASKDKLMGNGVIGRTILLDKMVKDFIKQNSNVTIINIASGMDTRFYRVNNSKIKWYNVDFQEVINFRNKYLDEDKNVTNIASSAMDKNWAERVEENENVLIIVEGLSMYLTEKDVIKIFEIIKDNFKNTTIFFEILNPKFVKSLVEKSVKIQFTWGANSGKDICNLVDGFEFIEDISLVEGMKEFKPIYKLLEKIKFIRNLFNKIAVLKI